MRRDLAIYNLRVMVAVVHIVYVYNTSRSIFGYTLLKIAQIASNKTLSSGLHWWTGDHKTQKNQNHCKYVERKRLPYMNGHITTVFTRTPAASLKGKIDSSNAESKRDFTSGE